MLRSSLSLSKNKLIIFSFVQANTDDNDKNDAANRHNDQGHDDSLTKARAIYLITGCFTIVWLKNAWSIYLIFGNIRIEGFSCGIIR